MTKVYIIGVGQIPVRRKTPELGRRMAATAIRRAIDDANQPRIQALYVGNMMSGILCDQMQLGALVADTAGLRGIEAMTIEAACGSGGAAIRTAYAAVAGGLHDVVVACGVEKMTHAPKDKTTKALATASDWTREGAKGASFISLNARMMATYMDAYDVGPRAFAPFAINAHTNAINNPHAVFHKHVDRDTYLDSRELVPPVCLYDASPICDGAAAIVLASEEVVRQQGGPRVAITGSAMATDTLGLKDRRSLLHLDAVKASSHAAYEQAGVGPAGIELFELHDAYTIISVLSLESAGFATPGHGWRLGADGRITPQGKLPISTMGGLKSRGHPVGASGIYQAVEATLQLRGDAGRCQIERKGGLRTAMIQSVGGTGATVATHILQRHS